MLPTTSNAPYKVNMWQTNEQKHDADEFFKQQFVPQPADKTLDEIVENGRQQIMTGTSYKNAIRQASLEYAGPLPI